MEERYDSIDLLRGVAILIMLSANAWPYLYPFEYCPFLVRIIFSSAAPIFIFLSGYSIHLSLKSGKSTNQLISRGIQIFTIGFMIDTLIWNILPVVNFDVLYLIGLSTITITLSRKYILTLLLVITSAFIIARLYISHLYNFNIPDLDLLVYHPDINLTNIIKRILWDGWFPVLPWTIIAIAGFIIAENRSYLQKFKLPFILAGISLLLIYAYLLPQSSIQPHRNRYTELFYPLSGFFTIYVMALLSICIFIHFHKFSKFTPIKKLGKVSLSIYLSHTIIIRFILPLFMSNENNFSWIIFAMGLFVLYLLIFLATFTLNKLRSRIKQSSTYLAFVLGL